MSRDPLRFEPVPVRLNACAKTFPGGTRALEPIDLEIAGGETVVFLGPSGCGKTTTLRIIAGLEQPDPGGSVFFGSDDVTALPIERRNVGMVFQSYALFPNMDVAQNVGYGLRVRGIDRRRRDARVGEMLAMMQMEALARRRIDQLSGGQRQRVALARALVVRPRILLLDEPLTALDAKLRDGLRLEIDRLLRQLGITAIYVTHDQGEAMALADRIVVMSGGRVVQIGTPRDVYFRPADPFVADFVGTTNRLQAQAADGCLHVLGVDFPWAGATGPLAVLVRPEDVRLDAATGQAEAKVTTAMFLGDRTRLVVETGTGETLSIDAPGRASFAIGDTVRIAIDPDRLLAMPL